MAVRRRFVGSYGSPLRGTVVAGGDAVASNAKQVDELNESLKMLRDQEALQKLSDGNPEFFLTYARKRIQELGDSHPNLPVWQDLIARAEIKLAQNEWAADLEAERKTLEQFQAYLEEQFKKASPGSAAATNFIKAIDGTKKAIIARDEAKKDQQAILSFVKTNDYDAYSEYLKGKLTRSTDPKVQQVLVGQIEELAARKEKAAQVARAQQVNDILTSYRSGDWDATKTIQALHHIAQTSKGITASEVNSLNSAVASVFNEEEQKMKAAASRGAAAANAQASNMVNAAERAYAQAESVIQYKLKYGVQVTPEDINKLEAAEAVLKEAYTKAATMTTDSKTVDTWLTNVINLPEKTAATKVAIDDSARKGITPEDVFSAQLKGVTPDAAGMEQAIALYDRRMRELGIAAQKTNTPAGKAKIQSEMEQTAAQEAAAIKTLATTKGKSDESALRRIWRAYINSEKVETRVESFDEFSRLIGMANDLLDLESLIGYEKGALPKGKFEEAKSAWEKANAKVFDPDATKKAEDAALKFIQSPFTPPSAVNPFIATLARQGGGTYGSYPDWFKEMFPSSLEKGLQDVHGPGGARDPFASEKPTMGQPSMLGPETAPADPGAQTPQQQQLGFIHGDGGARDPFRDAYEYLDMDTPVDMPGITIPELPSESPYLTAGDYSFNFESFFSDPFGPGGPLENIHGDGGARDPFAGDTEFAPPPSGGGGTGYRF